MSTIQIYIIKLIANFSSSCHFKIKVVFSSSPYRESTENKHSFKYEKGSSEVNIYEILNLKPFHPLTSEDKLQFFLEVYTRTGYKTAGVGVLHLSRGITANETIKIEIKKCPLGKGNLELKFLDFNLKPSPLIKQIKIPHQRKISEDKISSYTNLNTFSNNIHDKSIISDISYTTNMTNIEPLTSNYNSNSPKNYHIKFNNSPQKANNYNNLTNENTNDNILNKKDKQINELKSKITYYEGENNKLKDLIKKYKEEKNKLLNQQKEKFQKIINEKENLQNKISTLQNNINTLNNNKNESELQVINIKNQTNKKINDLILQVNSLNNIKIKLENDNKSKEEKLLVLDRQFKEMSMNYQRKINDLNNSVENSKFLNYNEELKLKDEEIGKLNNKIKSMESNIQSLNDIIELNDYKKKENEILKLKEKNSQLLKQISSKNNKIFDLENEISDLNKKIESQIDIKNQDIYSQRNEKEKIEELKNIIKEKNNELNQLRNENNTLKFNSKKNKIHFIEDSDDEKENGYSEVLIDQIKDNQKISKERDKKLNKDFSIDSEYNNKNMKEYINEINRLKTLNINLLADLREYKDLNSKYIDNGKKSSVFETENIKLQKLLKEKNEEIDLLNRKQEELEKEKKSLEKQLVNSKGKLGEVLNELAEVEIKYVRLEEKQRKMKKVFLKEEENDSN